MLRLNPEHWTERHYGSKLTIYKHRREPVIVKVDWLTGIGRVYHLELEGGRIVQRLMKKERIGR